MLPFTGLSYPEGLAVDRAGNVYVADRGNDRVVKLPAGPNTQTVLPFTGLNNPDGVAVDSAGNVFVTDTDNNRVVKLDGRLKRTDSAAVHRDQRCRGAIVVDDAGDVLCQQSTTTIRY